MEASDGKTFQVSRRYRLLSSGFSSNHIASVPPSKSNKGGTSVCADATTTTTASTRSRHHHRRRLKDHNKPPKPQRRAKLQRPIVPYLIIIIIIICLTLSQQEQSLNQSTPSNKKSRAVVRTQNRKKKKENEMKSIFDSKFSPFSTVQIMCFRRWVLHRRFWRFGVFGVLILLLNPECQFILIILAGCTTLYTIYLLTL